MRALKSYYFIGIGGIGMSALAKYLCDQGHAVYGYDKTPSEITDKLSSQGISITFDASVGALPDVVKNTSTTVIYSAAIPSDHPQFSYFQKQGNTLKKRALFLAEVCSNLTTIAIAGTHGKSTTSAILAHIFYETNQSFTAFLGAVINKYETNLISTGSEYAIVEADEFDRSFLNLHPQIACVTSMDADHLDIYGNKTSMDDAFRTFSSQVSGSLLVSEGLSVKGITYGFDVSNDYYISNIVKTATGYKFDIKTPKANITKVVFNHLGMHNLVNALCAVALADLAEIPLKAAAASLTTFPGVQRRMSVIALDSKTIIDDYAHHPTEIRSVLNTLKAFYPERVNCVVFQPHLYSRTRDFMTEFAEVLSSFDEVILLDVYPAREKPIAGINSNALLDKIKNPLKQIVLKETLYESLDRSQAQVIAMLGAGDIGLEVPKVIEHLKQRHESM